MDSGHAITPKGIMLLDLAAGHSQGTTGGSRFTACACEGICGGQQTSKYNACFQHQSFHYSFPFEKWADHLPTSV